VRPRRQGLALLCGLSTSPLEVEEGRLWHALRPCARPIRATVMSVIYKFPRTVSRTCNAAAAVAIVGAVAFVLVPGGVVSDKVWSGAVLSLFAASVLLYGRYIRLYTVNIDEEHLEYGASTKTAVRLGDITSMQLLVGRASKYLAISVKSGDRHNVPASLANFPSLMDEIERRANMRILKLA